MQYTLSIAGNTSGPYSEEQLRAMLAAGEVAAEDHIWAEGMADWTPLGALFPPPAPAPVAYHVSDNEQPQGPYSAEELQRLAGIRHLSPAALVWAEGFAEWVPVGTIVTMPASAPSPEPARVAVPVARAVQPVRAGVQPGVAAGVRPGAGSARAAAPMAVGSGGRAVGVAPKPMLLASRGARLGAYLLDMVVAAVSLAPGPLLLASGSFGDNQVMVSSLVGGLIALATMVYQIIILSARGQTLGKTWVGIKIVTVPGNANPGFVRAFLLRVLVAQGLLSPMGLIDLCFIFRADRRCIHDLIAATKVVNA